MNKLKMHRETASTLVEVLVAVAIIALVLTAVGAMMSMSIKLASSNEQKKLALHRAEEGLEFFRKERMTSSWYSFAQALLSNPAGLYCMTDFPSDMATLVAATGPCPPPENLEGTIYLFQRLARVEAVDPNKIKVSIEVSWQDGKRESWQADAKTQSLVLEQNFENF